MHRWFERGFVFCLLALLPQCVSALEERRPHAVFIVGTPHYDPISTMPELAKQLESCGFKTTVVLPNENPEKISIDVGQRRLLM